MLRTILLPVIYLTMVSGDYPVTKPRCAGHCRQSWIMSSKTEWGAYNGVEVQAIQTFALCSPNSGIRELELTSKQETLPTAEIPYRNIAAFIVSGHLAGRALPGTYCSNVTCWTSYKVCRGRKQATQLACRRFGEITGDVWVHQVRGCLDWQHCRAARKH